MNTTDTTSLTGRYLMPEDLSQVMALQDTIAEGLAKAGTPRHIVKRSEEYFQKHLNDPHAMYGMINEQGQIVAQAIFRISDIDMMDELCINFLPGRKEHEQLSIAQGVLVHPDYQGYGLMQMLLDKWVEWCKENEIHHLAARTESSHFTSQKGFLKNSFNKVATVVDPKDNAQVCVLHRVLEEEKLESFESLVVDLTCPQNG